jgi:hypothetical protein
MKVGCLRVRIIGLGWELLSRVESEVVATQKPVRDFNNLLHLGRLCA